MVMPIEQALSNRDRILKEAKERQESAPFVFTRDGYIGRDLGPSNEHVKVELDKIAKGAGASGLEFSNFKDSIKATYHQPEDKTFALHGPDNAILHFGRTHGLAYMSLHNAKGVVYDLGGRVSTMWQDESGFPRIVNIDVPSNYTETRTVPRKFLGLPIGKRTIIEKFTQNMRIQVEFEIPEGYEGRVGDMYKGRMNIDMMHFNHPEYRHALDGIASALFGYIP